MCLKFPHFKIVIKNLVGGRLAWALAHGTNDSEQLSELLYGDVRLLVSQ